MKWKRSKKAHHDAKQGNKDSRSSSSTRSRSPHNHQSSEDEKSSNSNSTKPVAGEKVFNSSSGDLAPAATVALIPPPQSMSLHHPHLSHPSTTSNTSPRIYGAGNVMDFSAASASGEQQQQQPLEKPQPNGALLMMKRPPLFFPDDANGEMFRPYVS